MERLQVLGPAAAGDADQAERPCDGPGVPGKRVTQQGGARRERMDILRLVPQGVALIGDALLRAEGLGLLERRLKHICYLVAEGVYGIRVCGRGGSDAEAKDKQRDKSPIHEVPLVSSHMISCSPSVGSASQED